MKILLYLLYKSIEFIRVWFVLSLAYCYVGFIDMIEKLIKYLIACYRKVYGK